MKKLLLLLLIGGCCDYTCKADTYELAVNAGTKQWYGSAVCVGSVGNTSILVTARHNLIDAPVDGVFLSVNQQVGRVPIKNAILDSTYDVASFEVDVPLVPTPLCSDVNVGDSVKVVGFGPRLHSSQEPDSFIGTISNTVNGTDWDMELTSNKHVITGDSGGEVLLDGTKLCVGIVSNYSFPEMVTGVATAQSRTQYARYKPKTGFVSSKTVVRFMQRTYQCGPQGCPIQLVPRYQQPMIGIGIPVGPPRVIQQAVPYQEPKVYVPTPTPIVRQPTPTPDPITITGPRGVQGPPGPQGPPGRDGNDGRSVKAEEIEAVIIAWLDSNKDSLRGPPGLTGPAGRSIDKEDIQFAVDKWLKENYTTPVTEEVDLTDIEARLANLETRKIRIITSSGKKIIDDETYTGSNDDPIILDINKITSAVASK